MNEIIFLITLLVSFLGIISGIILSNFAVEEIDNTSKYLKLLNVIIVPTIVFIATYNLNLIYSSIAAVLILLALYVLRNKITTPRWTYYSMSTILCISLLGTKTLEVAVLIFIYGVSIATINASSFLKRKVLGEVSWKENKELIIKSLKNYGSYLIIGIISYVVYYFV